MKKVAIDIALIPPKEIIDLSVEMSKSMQPNKIELHPTRQIPHITLVMGGVLEDDLPKFQKIVDQVVMKFRPLDLQIMGINYTGASTEFSIQKSNQIKKLHQRLLQELDGFLKFNCELDSLYDHKNTNEKTLFWINGFEKYRANDDYRPHITLGLGGLDESAAEKIKLPIKFKVEKIALCHLGNFCTCRKILFETDLQ